MFSPIFDPLATDTEPRPTTTSQTSNTDVIVHGRVLRKTYVFDRSENVQFLTEWAAQVTTRVEFNALPKEIRCYIWELSVDFTPRLVAVHYDARIGRFHTTTPSPQILYICKESRQQAMEFYSLYFGTKAYQAAIQIDIDNDTVQLHWGPLRLGAVPSNVFENIRYLELCGKDLQGYHEIVPIVNAIKRFNALESVTIVSPRPSNIGFAPYEERHGVHWMQLAHQLEYRHRHQVASSMRCRVWFELQHARQLSDLGLDSRNVPKVMLLSTKEDGTRGDGFDL